MTLLSTGPYLFTDEELKARPLTDTELRQDILNEGIDLVRRLKAGNCETTWKEQDEDGISIVVDLIHPVQVFLTETWGADKEKYIYDDYRYRFADRDNYRAACLDAVFKYLDSRDWIAFVEAIDFSSVEFDQPWVERTPDPDMSWI